MRWQGRAMTALGAGLLAITLGSGPALADETPAPTAPPTPTETPLPSPTETPDPAPTTPGTQDTLALPMHAGDTGRYVGVLQTRLTWMRYSIAADETAAQRYGQTTRKAVLALQNKFFLIPTGRVNERTWKVLASVSSPVGWVPKACRTGTVLCIDKTQKLLRFMHDGRIATTLDARFGTSDMPTREGRFRVFDKSRDHWSSAYHTWMPFAMFFSGGQAVHYSPYFHRDGYFGGSHGCIGLRDFKAARWLFDRVPVGTPVFVYRS